MIRAGELRERIRIERNTPTRSPSGAPVESWQLVAEQWAKPIDTTAREFERAYMVNSEVRQVWVIRGPLDVTATMRVTHHGRVFDVIGVLTADGRAPERSREIHLLCRTGLSANS